MIWWLIFMESLTFSTVGMFRIVQKLLSGLGFAVSDFQRQVIEFSGGWRIRLNLAQALMTPSDLLLLDEPTNHLDLEATLWLQQWLLRYEGSLLLISHDRSFIDVIVDHIVCFENKALFLTKETL